MATEENGWAVRGGDADFTSGLLALLLKDHATKVALVALFSTIMVNEFTDQIILAMLESSPTLLVAPNNNEQRYSIF